MALKQKPIKYQQGNQELEVIDFDSLRTIGGIEDPPLDPGLIDFDALRQKGNIEILTPMYEGMEPPPPPLVVKSDDDRKERVSQIDAEVNQIEGELRKLSEGLYEDLGLDDELKRKERRDEANIRRREIRELTGERAKLQRELEPISQEIKNIIVAGTKNNQYLDRVDQYGEDLVHQSLSEARSKDIGAYFKNRYKNVTPEKYDGTKFDFAYMLHGKREPIQHKQTTAEGAQVLWEDIRDDLEYRQGDFLNRRAHIARKIQEHVAEKFKPVEGKEPVSEQIKDSYKAELQEYMVDAYNFTDQGGLSNNGVQSFAEYIHYTAGDYLAELQKERQKTSGLLGEAYAMPAMGQTPVRKIENKDQRNAEYYHKFIVEEIQRTQTALKYAKKIINAPTSPNLSTFGQGLKRSHSPIDLLSLGITEMVDAFGLLDIANKQIDGRRLTHSEDIMMAMYLALQEANSFERKEIRIGNSNITIKPENIGKNITAMLPYIASFVFSGFAYKGTAAAATRGAGKIISKKITSKVLFKYGKQKTTYTLGDLAVKNAARVTGVAAQTAILPQYYMKHTAERMYEPGERLEFNEESKEIMAELWQNQVEPGEALKKGYWEAYSEIFTERAGLHLMKPFKFVGKAAAKGLTGKKAAQMTFVKYLKNLKGIKTNSQLRDLIVRRKMGWHGASAEYMEELASLFMASAGTKDPIEYGGGKFVSNQLETFLTVAIFGGAANMGQYLVQNAIGDNIQFEKADGIKFKIPYDLYKRIKKVYDAEGQFSGDAMAEAIAPYAKKLTQEQRTGIMELTLDNILKRNAVTTVGETQKEGEPTPEALRQAAKTDILKDYVSGKAPVEPVDVRPKVTTQEQKEVDAFNKNIEERFPDLVQAEMVPKNEKGQYERPDADWMRAELEAVDAELASKAKYGERSGKIINRTDEIREIEYRQNILRNYLHAYEEYTAIPWGQLIQSEKFEVLSDELRADETQQVSLDYIAGQETLGIKLEDGRVLRGRWDPKIPKTSRPTIGKRMKAGEQFTLKLEKKEDWDPKNKASDYNREKDPDAPFPGDRIAIYDNKKKFIGVAYVQNYRGEEVARAEKYREITDQLKENLTGALGFGAEWLADMIKARNLAVPDPDLANEFRNKLFGFIKNNEELAELAISDAINTIKRAVRESMTMLNEHKKFILDMIDENLDLITGYLVNLKRELGTEVPHIKVKAKLTHARDLRLKNSEAVTMSGAVKVEENLRTYAPLWRELADDLRVGRDLVEKTFFQMAVANPLQVTSEDTFQFYLDENKSDDRVQNAIIEKLRILDFGSVVSIFNFYENVRLVSQFGIFINKGVLQRKELNPPINLEDFINKFLNKTNTYVFIDEGVTSEGETYTREYSGIEAISERLNRHREYVNVMKERFMDKTSAERTEIRREIHMSDLTLLSELTGLSVTTWKDYFISRTKETVAYTTPRLDKEQDFKSYDKLLEKDTYRPAKKGAQPRVQSVLASQLTYVVQWNDQGQKLAPEEFKEAYNTFFTKGKEDRNVFSNLYKLSTASTDKNDIGLKGFDIKGDQFNSFIQFSHRMKIIEEKGMDFIIQNGMRNIDEKKQGTQTLNMTLNDIWLSAFSLFLENPDSYYHNIGQFADKPEIAYVRVDKIRTEKITPKFRIPMNFKDGDGGRQMRQEFKGRSTMDLILSGDRTATSRDYSKPSNRRELRVGDIVEFYSNDGRTALVEITKEPYPIAEISREEWSKLEGWAPSVNDKLDENYIQYQFKLIDQVKKEIKLRPELEKAADYMLKEYLLPYQQYFLERTRGGFIGLAAGYEGKDAHGKLRNLAKDFVSNFAHNSAVLNKLFHGNLDMYAEQNKEGDLVYDNAFIDMTKRASSSNSPGYRLNRYVDGGVGHEYSFAVLNDDIEGLGEIFDGVVFMSGEYAAKVAISMGDIYYKPEQNERLSSAKILSSFIDSETHNRGLTKGNWLNIDIFAEAEALKDSAYGDIQKLMKKNKIDVLSFTSTTKKLEKGKPANLFNKKGRITTFTLAEENKIVHSTEDLIVQQDLRHPVLPNDSKQPVQFLANILVLPHATDIVETIYTYQQMVLNDFNKTLAQKEELTGKLDWIIKNTNPVSEREVWELLFSGMLPTEPSLQALLRTKLSSEVTTRALELSINRATTQEVPDPNEILKSRRPSKDGRHILLPQCGISFPDVGTEPGGVRFPQKMNSQEEAIQHVQAQKDIYPDLFMPDGTLMSWEIEDGVIPGEAIMLTRIPADHPHSHTIARATVRIPGGNFTMLDKESQIASGSDFDGDYRFNTVFYKSRNGTILMDEKSKKGRANRILYYTMLDFINPEYDAYIRAGIDTKAYKNIVDRWKKVYKSGQYKSDNPRAYEESRRTNMTGVDMKGILTDLNTIFSLVSYLKIRFKKRISIRGLEGLELSGIINDYYGMMKIHLTNLQNMAFDNTKDPGLEYMGLNEITAQMFILALIGNKSLDSGRFKNAEVHYKAILAAVNKLSNLFNSDIYREFVSQMRKSKGATGKKKPAEIFLSMSESEMWDNDDVANLRTFYYAANELSDIRTFFNLTKKAPLTSADLYMARQTIKKIKLSSFQPQRGKKPPKNSFSLFDTSSFYSKSGNYHKLFRIINDTMAISGSVIFNDAFEHTVIGQQIMAAIWGRISKNDPKKIDYTRNELRAIIRAINNVVAMQALEPTRTAKAAEKLLVVSLNNLRDRFEGNKFINNIQKQIYWDPIPGDIQNRTTGIEINYDYRHAGFSEEELAEIKADFDKLPEKLKNTLVQYALYRWGTTTTTGGGSYYSLVGPKFRILFSRKVWDVLEKWKDDLLSPEEKLDVMEMALRNIYDESLRKLSIVKPDFAKEIDPASAGIIDYPISYEALDALSTVQSEEDLARVAEEFTIDINELTVYAKKLTEKETLDAFARAILNKRSRVASDLFGQNKPTDLETRNMMPSDALGEALASEDPALQEFIFNHLSKSYPGVQFFTNRDAFYAFVKRNGGRLMDIDTNAIGHAFGNAVFINENKAKQSTLLHEHAHIYWDALPEDDPAKESLRSFYMNNTNETFADLDELDERIIVDIGKVGTNIAKIKFTGSVLQRFLQIVRDFWRNVKKLIGDQTGKDILTDMSIAVWNNQGQMGPLTMPGTAVMRNMIKYGGQVSQSEKDQTVAIGNKFFISATRLKNLFKNSVYDSEENAKKAVKRMKIWYEKMTKGQPLPKEIKDAEIRRQIALDTEKTEVGTDFHRIAEHTFGDELLDLTDVQDHFVSEIAFFNAKESFKDFRHWMESDSFKLYLQEHFDYTEPIEKIKFTTEYKIVDTKYGVTGIIDLVMDLGNNNLVIADFKTTDSNYITEQGEPTESYSATFLPFKNPIGFLSESKQNEHRLQLHTYRKLIENIKDPNDPDAKNKVIGMMIMPIIRHLSPESLLITSSDIPTFSKVREGKIYKVVDVLPTEKRLIKATDLMFNSAKQSVDSKNEFLGQLRENLIKQKLEAEVITDMELAYDFFETFLPNGLKIIKGIDIEGIQSNSLTGILSELPDLGYTKRDLLGEDKLTIEELFWAATKGIEKEDLDKNFIKYDVYSNFIKHEIEDAPPKGWYRHIIKRGDDNMLDSELIIYDAGFNDLKENDSFLRIYPLVGKSGVQEYPTHFYKVINVHITHEGAAAVVVAVDETGSEFEFDDILPDDGIHKIHPGTQPIPKDVTVKDEFVERHYYSEEKYRERHFDMQKTKADFGTGGDQQAAWASFQSAQRRQWAFFNQYDDIPKLRKFLNDQHAVSEFLDQLRTTTPTVTGALAELIQQAALNHHFAEYMTRENQHGPTGLMPVTLELYYMINNQESVIYNDFPQFNMNLPDRMIPLEYIPFSMMQYTISAALRRVQVASFEHNRIGKDLNKDLDLEKMTETDPHTKVLKWVHPDDPSVIGTKEADALEYIYSMHTQYHPDYRLLMQERKSASKRKYPRKIPVSKSFMTRKEFRSRFGSLNGKMLHQNLKNSSYDGIKVTLREKVVKGRTHYYVKQLDEKGNPIMMTLREIKDKFIAEHLDPEGIRLYFGNRFQRYLMRQKLTGTVPRTMLAAYVKEARRKYKDKNLRNTLGYDILQHRRRIVRPDMVNPKFSTEYYFEGEAKAIDQMIFRHHMKNTLGPLEYTIARYNDFHDGSFAGKWLRMWTDKVLFSIHPYMEGEMWRIAFDFIKRLNSLNKIAFSVKTQVTNFLVGQSFDVIFEPGATTRGISRIFKGGPIEVIANIQKARAILKRYGIVNIVDETEFEKLEKEHYIGFIPMHWVEAKGYAPMDFIEKFNQFPVFIGLMTDKEWAAYDKKGNVIDEVNVLADFKIHQMALRVRSIHGDYGAKAAAPSWNRWFIDAILQFRKWVPALMYRYYHVHKYNQEFFLESGMLNGLAAVYKIVQHNWDVKKHGSMAALEEAERRISEIKMDEELRPLHIRNLQHYIDKLIEHIEGDPIRFKDLPRNEMKAIRTLALSATIPFITSFILWSGLQAIMMVIGGDDDEDPVKYKKHYWQQFRALLQRHYADVWYLANIDQMEQTLENLLPFMSMGLGMWKFIVDFAHLMTHDPGAIYSKDTFKYPEGLPKVFTDVFLMLPGGSMMRQLYSVAHITYMKNTYETIQVPNNETIRLGDTKDHKMSKFKIHEYSQMYPEVSGDLKILFKKMGLIDHGMDLADYAKIVAALKDIENTKKKYTDAEKLYGYLVLADEDPEFGKLIREAVRDGDEYRKIFGWYDNQTTKRKQKNLEKILLEIEDRKEEKKNN